jgi:hypothetical protein
MIRPAKIIDTCFIKPRTSQLLVVRSTAPFKAKLFLIPLNNERICNNNVVGQATNNGEETINSIRFITTIENTFQK